MPRSPSITTQPISLINLTRSVLTAQNLRRHEEAAFQAGMPQASLMEQAIQGCSQWITSHFPRESHPKVVILAGSGMNGGDGCGIARCLQLLGYKTYLASLSDQDKRQELTSLQSSFAEQVGTTILPEKVDSLKIAKLCENADLVIDAIFGTGFKGPLDGPVAEVITSINEELQEKRRRERTLHSSENSPLELNKTKIISIDIPSGLESNGEGHSDNHRAVIADITLCIGAWKPVFFDDRFAKFYGRVELIPLGLPPISENDTVARLADLDSGLDLLKTLPGSAYDHKYSRGHLAIRAGSAKYPGASILALAGALSMRPGYTELITNGSTHFEQAQPFHHFPSVVRSGPEFFDTPWPASSNSKPKAFLIGPGCTDFLKAEIDFLKNWKGPAVIDAGALSSPELMQLWPYPETASLLAPRILTPHRGEFDLLCDALQERLPALSQMSLLAKAHAFANNIGVHLVLKGASTILASPHMPLKVWRSPEPRLAHAGTGDVLSGMIAALLARGLAPDAAMCAGVTMHSHAASTFQSDTRFEKQLLDVPLALATRVASLIDSHA